MNYLYKFLVRAVLYSILCFFSVAVNAQNEVLTGMVKDSATEMGVPFAQIAVQDSALKQSSSLCSPSGFFKLAGLHKGHYICKYQF